MPKYYSPEGNIEVWEEKPEGYYTVEEWQKMHPAPEPPEPTKEEKLAQLDAQYDADKAQIMQYFTEAIFMSNTELQAELKKEMTEIDTEYAEARKALLERSE